MILVREVFQAKYGEDDAVVAPCNEGVALIRDATG